MWILHIGVRQSDRGFGGREPSFDSEVAGVGLPLHCSHTKREVRNLPDSGRSIGGAFDGSTSQIGHERTFIDPVATNFLAIRIHCRTAPVADAPVNDYFALTQIKS